MEKLVVLVVLFLALLGGSIFGISHVPVAGPSIQIAGQNEKSQLPQENVQAAAQNPPFFDHVIIILMENNGYCDIITTCGGAGPYETKLANNYTLAGRCSSDSVCSIGGYTALSHPSEPNYGALISGNNYSDFGRDGICCYQDSHLNVIDRFVTSGISWQAYAENAGNSGTCSYSPPDSDHFPFLFFSDNNVPSRCANFLDATGSSKDSNFVNALNASGGWPNFIWLTPNNKDNGHDTGAAYGDNWLSGITPKILSSAMFTTQRSALFVIYDEGNGNYPRDYVYASWSGPVVKQGYVGSGSYNHYSILRTLEANWGFSPLTSNDGNANAMSEFFTKVSTSTTTTSIISSSSTRASQSSTSSSTTSSETSLSSTSLSSTTTSSSSAQVSPHLIGWGGIRLNEATSVNRNGTYVPSNVFPGQNMPDMERILMKMKDMGYNTVRVDFDPYCTDTVDYNSMSNYSQANADAAVQIAKYYGFWIIFDYHGYSDIFRNTDCWLSYWRPIVQNVGPLYPNIIWEPENEPDYTDCSNSPSSCPSLPSTISGDTSAVAYMGTAYQAWIDQARSLGDTHWIVVQNLCSYECRFTPGGDGNGLSSVNGWPNVTDPDVGKVFISIHSYMSYNYYKTIGWNNATADSVATGYYETVLAGARDKGWPVLNTEGGTDPLCGCNTPDIVLKGSAGYTKVTLHFIQALTNLYNGSSINWTWWPAGSWTNTANSGTYGALADNGWGSLLFSTSINSTSTTSTTSSVSVSSSTFSTATSSSSNSDSSLTTTTSSARSASASYAGNNNGRNCGQYNCDFVVLVTLVSSSVLVGGGLILSSYWKKKEFLMRS